MKCSEFYDLSSDHSPIFVHIYRNFENETEKCRLSTKKTNWSLFKAHITEYLDEIMSMKTEDEIIDVTEYFTKSLPAASWISTAKTKKFNKLAVEYS